jgi:hypothetical protein
VTRPRTSGRVQGEPVERRAHWLVVVQVIRLEGREATHPLRPGGKYYNVLPDPEYVPEGRSAARSGARLT